MLFRRLRRRVKRLLAAGEADDHSNRQYAVQHDRICDRGQALSAADASQAWTAFDFCYMPCGTSGLLFLAPGAVLPGLPEQFAYPAAFGNLLAAVLALVALAAVVRRSRLARPLRVRWAFPPRFPSPRPKLMRRLRRLLRKSAPHRSQKSKGWSVSCKRQKAFIAVWAARRSGGGSNRI